MFKKIMSVITVLAMILPIIGMIDRNRMDDDFVVLFIILIFLIVNLIALNIENTLSNTLFAYYFKRRKLEEQKKIKELEEIVK